MFGIFVISLLLLVGCSAINSESQEIPKNNTLSARINSDNFSLEIGDEVTLNCAHLKDLPNLDNYKSVSKPEQTGETVEDEKKRKLIEIEFDKDNWQI